MFFYNIGVSYFVCGEKIDIYSGTDPDMKEFAEAGLDYINMLGVIFAALPLYRIFPTKPYRDFTKCVKRLQRAGELLLCIISKMTVFSRKEDSRS